MGNAAPTAEEFWNEHFERQTPIVWRQAAADHPMVQLGRDGAEAFLAELSTRAGHNLITATSATPAAAGRMGFGEQRWVDWASADKPFAAFAQDVLQERRVPTGHCLYMQSATIRDALPELEPLSKLWFSDPARMIDERTQLWLGSGGQRIPVHRDESHSVAVMLAGAKEFTLFPPDELPNLYTTPRKELAGDPMRSAVDPKNPDYARHPRFERAMATARTIRLEPGDVMLLPAHWWHSVDSFGLNAMMNSRWFDVSLEQRADLTACFAHALVTARTVAPDQAERFAAQLQQALFADAGATARTPERRGALKASLRGAVAATRRSRRSLVQAPAIPLRINPSVTVTIGADAVELRRGHLLHFLPWEYLPLLREFTAASSPTAALARLAKAFDFDTDEANAHIERLTEAAILIAEDGPAVGESTASQQARVDAATAHIALLMASFPEHHLRTFECTVRTFAFKAHGDPYPHLPPGEQGMLGSPMRPETAATFKDQVRRNMGERLGVELLPEDFWTRPYRIAGGHACTVGEDGLAYDDAASGTRHRFGWNQLEVLTRFRQPRAPRHVLDEVREDWNTTDDHFRELLTGMIVAGTLVPA